jgi:hypothetical protein
VPAVLFAAHLMRSGVVLRYVHPSLWCLCLVAAAGAAAAARYWVGRAFVALVAVAILLQGIDGIEAPRKASWKPFLDFFAANRLGAASGIVTDPGLALLFDHYLPPEARPTRVTVEQSVDDYRSAAAHAMASQRLFWILSARPVDRLLAELPASAAICTGEIGYHAFLVVGQRPADLPPAIRGCAAQR